MLPAFVLNNVDGTNSQMSGNDAAEAWKEIVTQFRSLCFMRRQGNASDSEAILEEKLPRKIAAWSRTATDDTEAKRSQLEQMFREEQRRVDDVCALHELSTTQWRQDLMPMLTNNISEQIKSAVVAQLASQAAQQNQLGKEIKQALAEQFQLQAAREAAQQAMLQAVQKTMLEAARRPSPSSTPSAPVIRAGQGAAAGSSASSRIPFDDIPAIIDQINDDEKCHSTPRRTFSVRPNCDRN